MNWLKQLFSRRRLYYDLSEEMQQHLEEKIEELVASGLSRKEASAAARRAFGNATLLEEDSRAVWRWPSVEDFLQDIRYALSMMGRTPGFSVVTVLTLAIGIGANLAVFQLLHGTLFAQLPVAQPGQLYSLRAVKSPFDGQWFFSYAAYQSLRHATANAAPVIARSGSAEGIFQPNGRSPERASVQLVSDNFFEVLGVSPATGRLFFASDGEPGQNQWPAVLRYGFWKQSFGADTSVIGRKAVINGVPAVIVGIAPERFSGVVAGNAPDIWLPLAAQASGHFSSWFDSLGPGSGANIRASYLKQDSVFWLWVLARIPAATKSSAIASWTEALQPDLALIATASKDANDRGQILRSRVQLVSAAAGEGTFREEYSQPLLILMVMAGLVLLVGCVNLANLQLTRLLSRHREFAVRISLGAGRSRLLRQLLVENLLLALIGGLLAFIVARFSSALLLRWASGRGPAIALDLHMGWELFTLGAVLLITALIGFSVLPAWQMTRGDLASMMTSRADYSPLPGKNARRWSSPLLAGQVSFSLLLLGTAGLFTQTLLNLSQVNAGLDRDDVVSIHLDFTNTAFQEADLPGFYNRIVTRLKELPAVRDAAVTMCAIPGCIWNTAIHVSGHPEIPEKQMHGEENHVGTDYFRTLGVPLLEGRDFDERDLPTSQPVAIINHAFARKLFGSESPVGHRIGYKPAPDDAEYLIVGEIADARVDDLRSPPPPVAYFCINQRPAQAGTIEVRGSGQLEVLSSAIRQSLLSLDPNLPITEIVALSAEYDGGLSREKLLARLTGVFGFLALALAALGFYGLLSFNVARRTSEIGIRIALGASRASVHALVLRQLLGVFIAGAIPGIVFTEVISFMVRNLLYGTGAINLAPLLFATCVLAAVGLLAALRPSYRASRIDPMVAVRYE